MLKKVVVVVFILCAAGCEKNNWQTMDLDLVTGIYLRQTPHSPAIKLGNPNVFEGALILSPNPPFDFIGVMSDAAISDIWIIPAEAKKILSKTDFSDVYNTNTYSESQIASHSVLTLSDQGRESITLNIQDLEEGYYRIFVKTQGGIYWDNFYKAGPDFDLEGFIESWH